MTTKENWEALRAPFPHNAIDWVVSAESKDKSKKMWACYVDARAVQARLDEVLGPENWKVSYSHGPNTSADDIQATLAIRVGDEWIEKSDGAAAPKFEAVKGGYSSALRRAAVVWGIGRYLYEVDGIWLAASVKDWEVDDHAWHRIPDSAKVPEDRGSQKGETVRERLNGGSTPDKPESPQDSSLSEDDPENPVPPWLSHLVADLHDAGCSHEAIVKALRVEGDDDWRLKAHAWLVKQAKDDKAGNEEARAKFVKWIGSVQEKMTAAA
jgi:hypothetical protein